MPRATSSSATGYQNVSIRKIAERIEYSPAAIYGYFPSKDDIFLALAEEGFRLLFAFGGSPRPARGGSDRRAPRDVLALLRVQQGPPGILRAHVPRSQRAPHQPRLGTLRLRHGNEARDVGRIQTAIDAGEFPGGTAPEAIFRILLTAVHGAAAMRLCDRMEQGQDADALARDTLEAATAPGAESALF